LKKEEDLQQTPLPQQGRKRREAQRHQAVAPRDQLPMQQSEKLILQLQL